MNGILEERASIGTSCKVRRSMGFDSFLLTAVNADGAAVSYVFDITLGRLIPVELNGEAQIADSNGTIYLNVGGIVYTVSSDGILTETANGVPFTYTFTSPYTVISQDSEKIVVAQSNPNIW